MSKQKHTPGPWIVEDSSSGIHHDGGRWVRTGGLFSVRVVGGNFVSKSKPRIEDDERDANAALIAAAPDLLAACEAALRDVEHPKDIGRVSSRYGQTISMATQQVLREAIAKAKGQQ